ncbi:MAG: type IV pilin protein [Candidatus Competibacteraceae bacterium]|nr:MAG: type IV pilin protein [Candidatus Competibacteraceae bacterium]
MWRRVRGEGGFSLLELMIVVAVIGILAAIAYPSYQDSVRKSRRADAKSVLLNAAQWMERFYTENNRYHQNRAGTAVALPVGLTQAPIEGGTKYYNISLTDCAGAAAVTANTFTLSAVRIAGTAQANDRCGTLTLTNTGVRGVCVAAPPTADECWR